MFEWVCDRDSYQMLWSIIKKKYNEKVPERKILVELVIGKNRERVMYTPKQIYTTRPLYSLLKKHIDRYLFFY